MSETFEFTEPALARTTENALWLAQVCEGLVRFTSNGADVEPALAESYSTSADGKEWVFRLRPNVRFHDGTLLDAGAVRFGIMRLLDPNHPYHNPAALPAARAIFGDERDTERTYLRDIYTPDAQTVVLALSQPDLGFPRRLARVEAAIVSPKALQSAAAEGQTTVVGTGPMRVKAVRQGYSVTLERFEEYWGPRAKVAELEFRSVTDTNDRERALREGQCEIAQRFPLTRLVELRKEKRLRVYDAPAMHECVIWLNLNSAPLDQIGVRKAMSLAFNRTEAVKSLLRGFGSPALGFFPASAGDSPTSAVLDADSKLSQAKALLEQSGFREGFTLKLLVPQEERIWNPAGKTLGSWVAAQLRSVGITVVCEFLPVEEVRRRLIGGDFQAALWGFATPAGDAGDYLSQLSPLTEVNGVTQIFSHSRISELLRQQAESKSGTERRSAFGQINEELAQFMPWIPLFQAHQAVVCRREIVDFELHPLGLHRLWEVSWQLGR